MRTIQNLMDLHGRVAIVTGGGGHIGAAVAEALVELGAEVAIVDRDEAGVRAAAERLRAPSGPRVAEFVADLAAEGVARALPAQVVGRLGSLSILVNCAAFVGTTSLTGWAEPFERQGLSAWRAAMDVNITAVFELVQAAVPHLHKSKGATIVNIASIYGMVGPDWALYRGTSMANPAAYAASKGALLQFTRWLATTLGPDIRVNSLSPGGVARGQPDSFSEQYCARTPLRRMAAEEDFKGAIAYLASDLSAYVTGHNLVVDGGWTAW